LIGEKINATRKDIAEAIKDRNTEAITRVATAQAEAGADVIDVNATTKESGISEKIEDMRWTVGIIQSVVDKPLAVDSDIPDVLAAGLESVAGPTPWINSVTAESEKLEKILPLMKKFGGPAVALCIGDEGIPKDVDGRLRAARIIYDAGSELGIEPELLYFDPLVMPVSVDTKNGAIILETIRRIKADFPGAKTAVGLSNISFGLPLRAELNSTFLALCMGAGLDAAIVDPTNENTMTAFRAADALLGDDNFCRRFTKRYRSRKK